jgi:hypothetical protein
MHGKTTTSLFFLHVLIQSAVKPQEEVKLYDVYYYTVLDYLVLKPKVRAVTMLPHCSCAKISVQSLYVNLWYPVAVFCIILNDDHSTVEWLLLFAYG